MADVLEMRPTCERCEAPLPHDSADARICSYECTFCASCTDGELAGRCPNCGGDLQIRPARTDALVSPRRAVQAYADAWAAGDLMALLDRYDERFVLHYFGRSSLAGDHVGRDAALAALAEATARTERELVAIEDVLSGEGLGAIVARERLAGVGEVRRVLLYRTTDDRLAECWLFDEDQRAIDAIWG